MINETKLNLSASVENRAIEYILKGMDIIEAVKKAIDDENALCIEILQGTTERAKNVKNQMCKNVYAICHLQNALS
jgi:hypothetical protein